MIEVPHPVTLNIVVELLLPYSNMPCVSFVGFIEDLLFMPFSSS